MNKLTKEQIAEITSEMVPIGHPVRFLYKGQCVQSFETLELAPRGSNVVYHTTYWKFTKGTARKIACYTGTRAVFDKSFKPTKEADNG